MGGFRAASWVGVLVVLAAFLALPSGAHPESPLPSATPICPGITASSPQTLSTTPPPVPLSPCPGVVVGTYLGGQGTDSARDVAVDASGYAYVVGTTNSTDFPTTSDAYDPTYNGDTDRFDVRYGDVFVAKFDPQGTLVYSTYFGGSGADVGASIAVDVAGNAYVTGSTMSSDFPTTPGAYNRVRNGAWWDAFVAKFNPVGSLAYSTLLGGVQGDFGNSIAVDAFGQVYLAGDTESSDFPITSGAYASEGGHGVFNSGVFVAKLNPYGTDVAYSTVIGGSGQDWAEAVAVDPEGNVHVVGQTGSLDFPTTPGAVDATPDRPPYSWEAFAFKLSRDAGGLIYSTYLGGEGTDQAFAIAIDSNGNAHLAGGTSSIDFPTSPGAYDRTFNDEPGTGIEDAFVLGMSPNGELLYSTFLGGTGSEAAWAIYLDESDSLHVTGHTASAAFPTSPGAFDGTFNGFADVFTARLERDGRALNYSTYLGGGDDVLHESIAGWEFCQGPCEDLGRSLAVDPTGNTTIVGGTSSPDFPTTENAFDPTYNGEVDAFLIRIELIPEPNRAPVAYFDVRLSSEENGRITANASASADAEDADGLLEVRWDWEDDGIWDTGWSTMKEASHEYTWAGTYTIRLEVRDTGGLVGGTTREVVVSGLPPPLIIQLSASPDAGVVPLTVSFETTVSGGTSPYAYRWNFGDGGTTSLQNPSHSFETAGVYAVTLTVIDSHGVQMTARMSITVVLPLAVVLSANPASGVSPLTVSFSSVVTGGFEPYTYAWNFGDGGTSALRDPAHTFDAPGTYSVALALKDAQGRRVTESIEVIVKDLTATAASGAETPIWAAYAILAAIASGVAAVFLLRGQRRRTPPE